MGVASVQALLCSMIALSAAAIHGFTYAVRRKEPAHLWLAVSALGILAIAISTALLYEVRTAADGEFWQRVMLGAAAPALLGFHYFSLSLLEVERSRLDRWFGFGAGAMVLQLFWPGLIFGGAEIERSVAYLDLHYYARDLGSFGAAVVAAFGAYIVFVGRIWFVHRSKITDGGNLLIVTFSLHCLRSCCGDSSTRWTKWSGTRGCFTHSSHSVPKSCDRKIYSWRTATAWRRLARSQPASPMRSTTRSRSSLRT